MAQLNIRIADLDKETAEKVAQSAGFSLGEYLGTIVGYMSAHRTLPVLIKFKPVSIRPEEAFQRAIVKFRHAYLQVSDLCKNLAEGEMTPLEALREPINNIEVAQAFYKSNEALISMAAGQLERVSISEGEHTMFPRCREHFPHIPGFLRTAIRMVNMNNRPIHAQDLIEMREALKHAAHHINILQGMVEAEVSADARTVFFLRDVEEAVLCASRATRSGEAYLVCLAWKDRMDNYILQAKTEYEGLGVVPYLEELSVVWKKLQILGEVIHDHVKFTSAAMQGFDSGVIDDIKEILLAIKQRISVPER